jgi:hypothetical protein
VSKDLLRVSNWVAAFQTESVIENEAGLPQWKHNVALAALVASDQENGIRRMISKCHIDVTFRQE